MAPMDISSHPVILYLVTLSAVTLCMFGIDKLKARARRRRIPEKTLLFLCALGGTPGGGLGMMLFRHKISKPSFLLSYASIAMLQAVVIAAWWYYGR